MMAICIRCGATKTLPYQRCSGCGFRPNDNSDELAKSVYLSTGRFDDPVEQAQYEAELQDLSLKIRNGIEIVYDEHELRRLHAQKAAVESVEERGVSRYVFDLFLPGIVFVLILLGALVALRQL